MKLFHALLLVSLSVFTAMAQTTPSTTTPTAPGSANSDPTYQALRHITVGTEAVSVNNLVLQRAGATFTFTSGTFSFLAPVNGKVTGAVFIGDGNMTLKPPISIENRGIAMFTKGRTFQETFSRVVLRFTDDSYAEIKKGGAVVSGGSGDASGELDRIQGTLRDKIHFNLSGRILQDVLSSKTGGLFVAFIAGHLYNEKEIFCVDPRGLHDFGIQPEEVALVTYDLEKQGIWVAYHLPEEYASHTATGTQHNGLAYAEHHKLNTTIEKSGRLEGDSESTFVAGVDDLRVVPLDLFPTLRVTAVTDGTGQQLSFIQEDRWKDPDFFVILPKGVMKDERFTIHVKYAGKEAVLNEGDGNYYPVARDDWYPNTYFGNFATYDMTFRIPKGLKMVATGRLVSDKADSGQDVSEWQSDVPIAVGGFNFGKYRTMTANLQKLGIAVEAYANENPPDWVKNVQGIVSGQITETGGFPRGNPGGDPNVGLGDMALGTMDTTTMMKRPLAEAQVAMILYTDYFGPVSYKRVAISQQTACGYGQSWPTLVYLPICSFFDSTVRHNLGLDEINRLGVDENNTFWNAVAAHETAHQWWGQTVGFESYRDQWMSEGFADLSASLFIQMNYTENKGDAFHRYWIDQKKIMLAPNEKGIRPIDVGPVTLGYRLDNSRAGFDIAQRLIYPKGAYILHMIRMMMWDPQTGDANFKAMMHDFVETYRNKPATTEDFKAMVEKHITQEMNLTRNGKLDWFFNEYVYDTYLPNYHFEYTFGKQPDGTPNVHVKLVQSNVDQNFGMLVPLYLEMNNGKIIRVGSAPMIGNSTADDTIPLTGLKETPKRALINYNQDVLSTTD